VEEDLVTRTLELLVELVVGVLQRPVEVALDDLGRPHGALLGVGELLRFDLWEARRELRRRGERRAAAGRLRLLAGLAFGALLRTAARHDEDQGCEHHATREDLSHRSLLV